MNSDCLLYHQNANKMNEPTFQKILAELKSELTGQKFGKIFPLSRNRLAIDFRLPDSKYLLISIEPNSPRIYLIRRRFKDLEAESRSPNSFVQYLRTRLSNGNLDEIDKYPNERILRFTFSSRNDVGQIDIYHMIGQFTGRSANIFLLDDRQYILDSWRENSGDGQEVNSKFLPPARKNAALRSGDPEVFQTGKFGSLSEALDQFYLERETETNFQNKAKKARDEVGKALGQRKRLQKNLLKDLENHGNPETWKRFGDLLLANIATAKRTGGFVAVVDYFDGEAPIIEIEVEENDSISQAAEKFFKKYTKARNARRQLADRLEAVDCEIAELESQKAKIERAVQEKDENFLESFSGEVEKPIRDRQKRTENFTGARRFTSSDGVEILVGRRAKDNDFLTFRIAKSLDYWFHAADYPGSHVVVRNPNKSEIPQTTLLEAAQIAAFFSQAKSEAKVAVHYTQKKFVNKPKGAIPGLVSLASFKTILVEPKIIPD